MATANVGGKSVAVNAPGVTQWSTPGSSIPQQTSQPINAPATMPAGGSSTPPAMAESIARASGGTTLPNPTGVTAQQFANPVPASNSVDTSQPNPKTVDATAFTQAHQIATASGVAAPQGNGEGASAVAKGLAAAQNAPTFYKPPGDPNPQQVYNAKGEKLSHDQYLAQGGKADYSNVQNAAVPAVTAPDKTTPNVDNFFNPQVNPTLQDTIKQLTDFLNPEETTKQLNDQLATIKTDQAIVAGLNTQLMNIDNIMAGTPDNIRSEIQASGGMGTESQVLALSIARNKTLLLQATQIQNKLTTAQNQVANDTTLFQNEKDMANTQFTQRMGIYQVAQTIQQNTLNAAKDSIKTLISTPGGLQAYLSNPNQANYADQIMGFAPGTINHLATTQIQQLQQAQANANLDTQLKQAQVNQIPLETAIKQAQLAQVKASTAKTYSDIANSNLLNTSANILSPYVKTSYNGTPYVDLSALTPSDKAKYAQIASKDGYQIILTPGDASKLNAIADANTNLKNIQDSVNKLILGNGLTTPTKGIGNSIAKFFGNTELKSYNAYRTAIINNVQALAGGAGSGLRINEAEINAAMNNDLPVVTGIHADTHASATAKLKNLTEQLNTWEKQLVGGGNTATGSGGDYQSYLKAIGQ